MRQGACALQHTLTDAHSGWIWSLIVSPDGNILFSGAGDCLLRWLGLSSRVLPSVQACNECGMNAT